ncbi:MAG: hypothetical protein J5545_11835 [Bacteroidaceae bacterium]|nr:hypothetical protein [Bacteroidaceae bacterium]
MARRHRHHQRRRPPTQPVARLDIGNDIPTPEEQIDRRQQGQQRHPDVEQHENHVM